MNYTIPIIVLLSITLIIITICLFKTPNGASGSVFKTPRGQSRSKSRNTGMNNQITTINKRNNIIPFKPINTYPWIQLVNTEPIVTFNMLYEKFFKEFNLVNAQNIVNFANDPSNNEILQEYSKSQIPYGVNTNFKSTLRIVSNDVKLLAKYPTMPSIKASLQEFMGDLQLCVPLPVTELYIWYDFLQNIPADPPQVQWYKLRDFFDSPFVYNLLLTQSTNNPVPYKNALFEFDWINVRHAADTWLCVNSMTSTIMGEGIAYEALMNCFDVIIKWCPKSGNDNFNREKILQIRDNTPVVGVTCKPYIYKQVNTNPVLEFVNLYDEYMSNKSDDKLFICKKLLKFLETTENIDVLADNSQYQNTIEISVGEPTFSSLLDNILYLLKQIIINPQNTTLIYAFSEYLGNFYYLCYDPYTAIKYWANILTGWSAGSDEYGPLEVYFKFLPKYFVNPYNYHILKNTASSAGHYNFDALWFCARRYNDILVTTYNQNHIFNHQSPFFKNAYDSLKALERITPDN